MIEKEIWKEYKTTFHNTWRGGYYITWEISNLGRVKKNGKLFKCKIHNTYYIVSKTHLHRVVAELFIPNLDNKPVVDHIDGNRLNNRVDNLRWVTYSENSRNPNTYYNQYVGENNPNYGNRWKKIKDDKLLS